MGGIERGISGLSAFGGAVALVGGAALVVWLIGLLIVLRGSEPAQRSEIIRAYALCHPLVYLRRSASPGGQCQATGAANAGAADGAPDADVGVARSYDLEGGNEELA